ncbi:MAG: aminoacyl-tRNA hydrolase [Kofleriaceae bacterium]|nr:aminoacyl-tRNA hydrolase [Kofleriaceae bacterium]MCL4226588.1 aminoacyl-tRNA hydrolase [Myxococcales bacterium]
MSDLVVNARVTIPADELREAFVRSGGPGGQNVNKVASKVELRWTPATSLALTFDERTWVLQRLGGRLTLDGELIVTSDRYRDQPRNRADAAEKLAAIVRTALERPKPRRATRPSKGSKERRIAAKKRRGAIKSGRRSGGETLH